MAMFQNTMLAYAVVRAITIVGEAANHVSLEFQQAHPEIPWHNVRDAQSYCSWL
jgi:uncharacterized protein with HEPN domain